MRTITLSIAICLWACISSAMEIIPPGMVLQEVIRTAHDGKLHSSLDTARIRENNQGRTDQDLLALLRQFTPDDIPECNSEKTCLSIPIVSPVEVTFVFEPRVGKWVDGGDYHYFVIVAITEHENNP